MTTPRKHADPAVRYFMDDTTNCWARNEGSNNEWALMPDPRFNVPGLEYYVGHEPPPPPKRTITLTVNGREWVLPERSGSEPEKGATYWTDAPGGVFRYVWQGDVIDKTNFRDQRVHASESDAQAWADFNKWCRGGGI